MPPFIQYTPRNSRMSFNVSQDISLGQWVGLTPHQIVQDTLNISDATVSAFKKEKQYIV